MLCLYRVGVPVGHGDQGQPGARAERHLDVVGERGAAGVLQYQRRLGQRADLDAGVPEHGAVGTPRRPAGRSPARRGAAPRATDTSSACSNRPQASALIRSNGVSTVPSRGSSRVHSGHRDAGRQVAVLVLAAPRPAAPAPRRPGRAAA